MDRKRFDALTRKIGQRASRRGVLGTTARGGVAALLAAVGLGVVTDGAGAAVKCGKKCRRRKGQAKKRCLRKCRRNNQRNRRRGGNQVSAPIGVGPVGLGGSCATSAQCASGNCTSVGICAHCSGIRLCGNRCCAVDASCIAGICFRL